MNKIKMNKNLEQDLLATIDTLSGTLLTVGIDDNVLLDIIDKNKNLNRNYNLEKRHKKQTKVEKQLCLNLKLRQLRKKLKNRVDYIICDVNGINNYLRDFINVSYTLTNKSIIYYGIYDEYDIDRMINKYKRFNVKTEKKIYDDSFLLIINTKKLKTTKFKLLKYRFIDFFKDLVDAIGNFIMG